MKRLHIHITVEDIESSTRFYRGLFGCEPVVTKSDYAKWVVDDPAVNLAISTDSGEAGVNHLGIQVDGYDDLNGIEERLRQASSDVIEQRDASCCYAESDKSWTFDPSGVPWETFLTMGESAVYGADTLDRAVEGHARSEPRRR